MLTILTITLLAACMLMERVWYLFGFSEPREGAKDGKVAALATKMQKWAKIDVFGLKMEVAARINYWDNIANYTPLSDLIRYIYRKSDDRFKTFYNLKSQFPSTNSIKVCPVSLEQQKNWTRPTCDFIKLNHTQMLNQQ